MSVAVLLLVVSVCVGLLTQGAEQTEYSAGLDPHPVQSPTFDSDEVAGLAEHPSAVDKRKPKSFYAWNGKRAEKRRPKSFYSWNGKRSEMENADPMDKETSPIKASKSKRTLLHYGSAKPRYGNRLGKYHYHHILGGYYRSRKDGNNFSEDKRKPKSFYSWNGKRDEKQAPRAFYHWNGKRSEGGDISQEHGEHLEDKRPKSFYAWNGKRQQGDEHSIGHNTDKRKPKSFYAWNGKRVDSDFREKDKRRGSKSFYTWNRKLASGPAGSDEKREGPKAFYAWNGKRTGSGVTRDDDEESSSEDASGVSHSNLGDGVDNEIGLADRELKRKFYHFSQDKSLL